MSETLNPSEAVYGFAGWLTCRKEKVVFSSGDDAAIVADLVKQFCDANNLPDVSEHWPQHLIHPKGEVAVPGVGQNKETNFCKCQNRDYWKDKGSNFCGACGGKL